MGEISKMPESLLLQLSTMSVWMPVVALVVACSPSTTYEQVLNSCDSWYPPPVSNATLSDTQQEDYISPANQIEMSESCRSVLIQSVNLDESSFEEAEGTVDVFLGGLLVLYTGSQETVSSLLEDPGLPDSLKTVASDFVDRGIVHHQSSVGELWFEYAQDRIRTVDFEGEKSSEMDSLMMVNSFGRLIVSHLSSADPLSNTETKSVIFVAGTILHEVSHVSETLDHVTCMDGYLSGFEVCDEETDSSYGYSALWSSRFIHEFSKSSFVYCLDAREILSLSCDRILAENTLCPADTSMAAVCSLPDE